MMKNCLFAMALLSLALASGCAKGGNGIVPPAIAVDITLPTGISNGAIYPTQTLTLTASVTPAGTNPAVTWALSGASCTGSACGTLTPVTPATIPATATYVAPAASTSVTVTATSVADTSASDALSITVTIATVVTPATLSVGAGLAQQFTAVAVPNYAPQTFTWTCTASGVPCKTFTPAPGVSSADPAVYTAADSCSGNCVQISAAPTVDSTATAVAKVSVVASRVTGTYAFRFSGYDSSSAATAVVGTFTASSGSITSGTEDELTASGLVHHSITGGSYNPIASSDPSSNNAGTLTLTTGAFPNKFQVALDGAGDIQMIESDGHGTGSGIAEKASTFNATVDQTFAFGFTGVDAAGHRIGYAGLIPMDGSGNIVGGLMDVNNGSAANGVCDTPPCTVAGTYKQTGGIWQLILTSPISMTFDFFAANGTSAASNPLTLYSISTDPGTNPAVSGTMVLQDSSKTYNNAAFSGLSVSALTGANGASNSNVSLTRGSTDGNGGFSGQFDQNNAGTILSSVQFPGSSTSYTYSASGTGGRYTFNMLGNPATSTVPLPFVLYASGANRGFLLDQSSSSVMTGTMSPQGKGSGILSDSELPGTWAAATTGSGSSGVDPLAANLLLTFANTGACTSDCVNGTLYDPAGATMAGAYTLMAAGNGTIKLTAPSTQSYVIYVVDTSGTCSLANPNCAIQDFLIMDVDESNKNASIIFAKQ